MLGRAGGVLLGFQTIFQPRSQVIGDVASQRYVRSSSTLGIAGVEQGIGDRPFLGQRETNPHSGPDLGSQARCTRLRRSRRWPLREQRVDGGEMIELEDGSLWAISALGRIDTMLWLTAESITVIEGNDPGYPYNFLNTDSGDSAATNLRSQ